MRLLHFAFFSVSSSSYNSQLASWNCSSQRTEFSPKQNWLFPREAGTASWCDLRQHCDLA
jgi:hypothetical protein